MIEEVSENDLIYLICWIFARDIEKSTVWKTSEIIKKVENFLEPKGVDATPYNKRNDSALSQKIRNLKSHKNRNIFNFFDIGKEKDAIWKIKDSGKIFLFDNFGFIKKLLEAKDYYGRITILRQIKIIDDYYKK